MASNERTVAFANASPVTLVGEDWLFAGLKVVSSKSPALLDKSEEAWPVIAAVIVPAEKFPEESLKTSVLAVFVLTALPTVVTVAETEEAEAPPT